jgi:hypothetical protein
MTTAVAGEGMTHAALDEEFAHLVEAVTAEGGSGGDVHGGPHGDGGGPPAPARAWPVIPAVIIVGIIAALLTALGMLTQICANLAGTQLPGS